MTARKNQGGDAFTRLVAGLEESSDEAEAAAARGRRVGWRGVPWPEGDAQDTPNPDLWTDTLAWLELGDEPPVTEPPPPADPTTIAAELGLSDELSALALHRLRRTFALRNHPDRCAPAHRELATQRMRIANMLIDAALKRATGGS